MKTSTTLLLASAAALAFTTSSCKKEKWPCVNGSGTDVTETRQVDAWTELEIDIAANVYITQDPNIDNHTVRIVAPEKVQDVLQTEVNGNTLELYTKRCIRKNDVIDVYVTVKDIDRIDMRGAGDVVGETPIETSVLDLKVSGSGTMDFDLDVNNLDTRITGSATITLIGEANRSDVNVSGSGDVKAYGLATTNCNVNISGSGSAEVNVTDNLDVDISGSGDVYYRGTPSIDTNITGSGNIHNDN